MNSDNQHRCILITGGSGFVGRTFLQRAAAQLGPAVPLVVADQNPQPGIPGVEGIALNIADREAVDNIVKSQRPYGILHLAAVSAVGDAARDVHGAWAVNATGTINLALSVRRHCPDARFVFIGSSEVYGRSFNTAPAPLDEQALLVPTNVYAATKAAADLMIGQMACDGLNAVRFRPFNHTGPGQSDKFVVAGFASQIAQIERGLTEPVLRVGNLEAQRDFLDVRDVVEAYLMTLTPAREFPAGAIFNLASGVPRRIGDVMQALLDRARVPIRVEQDPARMRHTDVRSTAGNAAYAQDRLGWCPQIPWSQTLDDTLESYRRKYR